MTSRPLKERFEEKVYYSIDGCHYWIASVDKKGYGKFKASKDRKAPSDRAHRVSYKLYIGDIPNGMHVLHTCDNPICVNPAHLFLGTNQDNVNDKVAKGRQSRMLGEKHPKSKLNAAQVLYIRQMRHVIPGKKLAEIYGVQTDYIHELWSGRHWTHLSKST